MNGQTLIAHWTTQSVDKLSTKQVYYYYKELEILGIFLSQHVSRGGGLLPTV